MTDTIDHAPAFLAAAVAPALVTALVFSCEFSGLAGGYGSGSLAISTAGIGFVAAFVIAGLHVAILAVPLHALLSERATSRPALVLAAAALIGGVPIPLIFQAGREAVMLFGLAGLIGGAAFLVVDRLSGAAGEAE